MVRGLGWLWVVLTLRLYLLSSELRLHLRLQHQLQPQQLLVQRVSVQQASTQSWRQAIGAVVPLVAALRSVGAVLLQLLFLG